MKGRNEGGIQVQILHWSKECCSASFFALKDNIELLICVLLQMLISTFVTKSNECVLNEHSESLDLQLHSQILNETMQADTILSWHQCLLLPSLYLYEESL